MDHANIVTATIQSKSQYYNPSHKQINYIENVYGIPSNIEYNLDQYLGKNKLFGTNNLSLKVIKKY